VPESGLADADALVDAVALEVCDTGVVGGAVVGFAVVASGRLPTVMFEFPLL
jgi:hypothetical protein